MIRPVQIRAEDDLPPRRVHHHDVRVASDARVVHEHVDRADIARDRLEKRGDGLLVGDVAAARPDTLPASCCRAFDLARCRFPGK